MEEVPGNVGSSLIDEFNKNMPSNINEFEQIEKLAKMTSMEAREIQELHKMTSM